MQMNVYSIHDRAAGVYTRPFFMQADAAALRSFQDLAADKEHEISRHPGDYTLFRVGLWNDNTAEIMPQTPEKLANALEIISARDDTEDEHL